MCTRTHSLPTSPEGSGITGLKFNYYSKEKAWKIEVTPTACCCTTTLGLCGWVAFPPEKSFESHQPCCLLSDQPINAEGKAGD